MYAREAERKNYMYKLNLIAFTAITLLIIIKKRFNYLFLVHSRMFCVENHLYVYLSR